MTTATTGSNIGSVPGPVASMMPEDPRWPLPPYGVQIAIVLVGGLVLLHGEDRLTPVSSLIRSSVRNDNRPLSCAACSASLVLLGMLGILLQPRTVRHQATGLRDSSPLSVTRSDTIPRRLAPRELELRVR
jgi:hypothetical protein